MRIALGLKSHSGWAVLVAIGGSRSEMRVVDRRRVPLVDADTQWAKQPYHAAQAHAPDRARELVQRGVDGARDAATRELRTVLTLLGESGHVVVACAVLIPPPMPDWSIDDILSVHVRMHKAEGVLFPAALCTAAEANGLRLVVIPEKALHQYAARSLGVPPSRVNARVGALGKSLGPPWGQDQKKAALAAVVALTGAAVGRE